MTSDFNIALHIVGFLTAQGGQPITSDTLAQTYGTSPVVLRRVLSRLQHAGVVETQRGVGGGSVLAQSASKINLRQVFDAVTPNQNLLRRHPQKDSPVSEILGGYINELCEQAEQALLKKLESITVKQMDAVVRPRIIASHCMKTKNKR
ncbi:MAG: Rrf2 family transcriptional regulator [Phycisphaeraceae bacterium]|nr:Rrf2 family transcriptional regulator [Phycisphaeraceae bacterium]